jgi:MAD (mothers against decapentaplegic) interacting protein
VEEKNSSSVETDSSSSDVTSSTSSGNDYELKKSDHIQPSSSHFDTDDSSKRLISEESSNHNDIDIVEVVGGEEQEDDQPVTTDLTLTKTVQLTEYDQEPEIEFKLDEPEKTADLNKEQIQDDKVVQEPVLPQEKVMIEEPIDNVKEMSHFESTMDDISDAELESLEQELDDLVAAAVIEGSLEKIPEESVLKSLEESIEKTVEIENEQVVKENEEEQPNVSESKITDESVATVEEKEEANAISEPEESAKVSENVVEIMELEASSIIESEQPESVSEAQEATEPPLSPQIVPPSPDPALSTSSTDESASIQNLPSQSNEDYSVNESNSTGSLTSEPKHGSVPPYWIPDTMTNQCMQCDQKFSLIKRRHHCRACGLLLCANCCNEKFFLHYLQGEGRICGPCHEILVKNQQQQQQQQPKNPNPANPLEYCSTIPIQQQVSTSSQQPITVMVPTGVLKRTTGGRSTERKSVIFSDGIRPGTDLDDTVTSGTSSTTPRAAPAEKSKFSNLPTLNEKNNSFISEAPNELPPILVKDGEYKYVDNNLTLLQRLRQEELNFAVNKNFYVTVKIVTCEYISFYHLSLEGN